MNVSTTEKKQRRRRWPIIATARRFRFRETAIPLGIIFLFRVEKFGLHVASQFPRQPRSRLNAATEPDELKNRDYANKKFPTHSSSQSFLQKISTA